MKDAVTWMLVGIPLGALLMVLASAVGDWLNRAAGRWTREDRATWAWKEMVGTKDVPEALQEARRAYHDRRRG